MNWLILLYNSLAVVVALDAVASIAAAKYMYMLRQRFGHYLAMTFTGVAAEASIAVLTMGFSGTPQKIIPWVVAVRILARLIKTVTMVMLSLFLLGYINGDHPEVMKDAK
jgi:hypothetical protein